MNSYRTFLVAGFCMLFVAQVQAAVVFQDDFSDPGTSHLGWVSSNEFVTRDFTDGVCMVRNTSTDYSGYVYHEPVAIPTIFTLSCTIKRLSDSVTTGIAVYYSTTGNYTILLGDQLIFVMKPGETSAQGIFCPDLEALENKIAVSKSGNKFNVFVNDRFVTTFTDTRLSAGKIAFVSYPKTAVSFDNVVLTDQFTEGSLPTCFSDAFDKTALTYWSKMSEKASVQVESGKLRMVAENNDSAYCSILTNIALTNFVMRVEVSHIEGNLNSIYGIMIKGPDTTNQASFVINGGRKFGSAMVGDSITMTPSAKVKGGAITVSGQKYFYVDTLEVIKKSGTGNYLFAINGSILDTLTGVNFSVTSVGIFCQNNVNLTFDNFITAEGDSAHCLVSTLIPGKRMRTPYSLTNQSYSGVYDILGRNVTSIKHGQLQRSRLAADGIYIDGRIQEKAILQKR